MFHIVLVEPEIPQNTGNIARTCAATGSRLHLIKPLGFAIDDRQIKRAGLDYWHLVDLRVYEGLSAFLAQHRGARLFFMSTKGQTCYADARFADGDCLVFGRETRGLPEDLLRENAGRTLRLPMRDEARSLNLSNSVAVTLYEALRQTGFASLARQGGGVCALE